MKLCWKTESVPEEIGAMLRTLADEYPLTENGSGTRLEFQYRKGNRRLYVRRTADGFLIECGSRTAAARGVAFALADQETEETQTFQTFGILLDCSRTGIVRVEHFKYWLRRLALLGYNMAMLYTKDAYRLPGETYFGYMRGAYAQEEIREIDAYAKKLGIEMIASIQALGHLEPVLRWQAYSKIKDTDNVLLVDEPESYVLVEKMIRFWSEALDSRRIHLGMDETHDLGRGRFFDRFGSQRPFDLYNRHLAKVCGICKKYHLRPIIWSDMYFRLGNKNLDYYDPATVIPDDVRSAIAPEAALSYWDYYHTDKHFYLDWIERHRALGKEPFMASGLWTWSRLWYDHEKSVHTAGPCIDACREAGLSELIFTMWGDDGGYCDFDSAFAGMAWAADYANHTEFSKERTEKIYSAVCGTSWEMQILPGTIEEYHYENGTEKWEINAPSVLWDDPLMGIVWHEYLYFGRNVWTDYAAHLRRIKEQLALCRNDKKAGNLSHAFQLCEVLEKKIEFRLALLDACRKKDRAAMEHFIPECETLIAVIEELKKTFREQWFRSYKPWGLEVMQIKLAGLQERYREVQRRLREFLNGTNPKLEELEIEPETSGMVDTRYRMIATGGWFI